MHTGTMKMNDLKYNIFPPPIPVPVQGQLELFKTKKMQDGYDEYKEGEKDQDIKHDAKSKRQ